MTHNGKIGRLPKSVQEQLNHRLEQGEKGRTLVAWLNSLPEVQAVLTAEFDGYPIREQNLSQWRKHGYQPWLWNREAQAIAAKTGELPVAGAQPLTDQMAGWVSVRYLMAVRKLVESNVGDKPDLKVLREFCHDVVALRRGEHRAARLKLEQQRQSRGGNHPD
jgi:hypothetical protein